MQLVQHMTLINSPGQYALLMDNLNDAYQKYVNIHAIMQSNTPHYITIEMKLAYSDRWISFLQALRDLNESVNKHD